MIEHLNTHREITKHGSQLRLDRRRALEQQNDTAAASPPEVKSHLWRPSDRTDTLHFECSNYCSPVRLDQVSSSLSIHADHLRQFWRTQACSRLLLLLDRCAGERNTQILRMQSTTGICQNMQRHKDRLASPNPTREPTEPS